LNTNQNILLFLNISKKEGELFKEFTFFFTDKWEVVEDHGKDEITLITCVSVKDNSKRYVVAGDW
jgi:hypothetical protein